MKIYDFTVKDMDNKDVSLSNYMGKVLLVINGATGCGFTPQYDGLQKLYDKYAPEGFEILDFPSNQFLEQAPGTNDEIANFCRLNFGTEFKQFSKIEVNGPNEDPLYKYLKTTAEEFRNQGSVDFYSRVKKYTPDIKENDIRWNFTKFLIDREGNVIARFAPNITAEEIDGHIASLLRNEEIEIVCHPDFSQGCI
ncbi:MAG TPA: glutathione peroxidase [Sedimentibacter sp.]|nr:glutathione peroxidase [Sedimentibacter sp.]HNZ83267.1 glutathione peroxidase [Sedimentibacter sp.]HOH70336.1 glutathione peroxidase [Sedimentibacter sp.]HPW99682.1 glutathione peroxidase [Sedimentibacter sp.]HQB63073.1 glutathione peroxidase [Sedimentibacter sp.]